MSLLARVELFKLATVRASYSLWAATVGLTIMFGAIEASRAGKPTSAVASLAAASGQSRVTTLTGWSLLFAAVLGVMVASGEHRHSSASQTYLATPDRRRVLAAKAVAAALAGSLFGLFSGLVSMAVGLAFTSGDGYRVVLGTGTLVAHIAGAALGAALFAAIGVGLGSLLRSQVAGIITVFMWGLVVESVIGGLFTSVRPYLPYTAATTLAGIKLGGAAFGPAHGLSGGSPLPFVAATALVAGAAVLLCAVAAVTTVQRDIA